MRTDNNHLVSEDFLKTLKEAEKQAYTPVPGNLQNAASRELAGRSSTFVSKHSGGKLSKWSASERKKKRKAQTQARKLNR